MIEAFWYPDTRLLLPAQSPVAVGRAATGASSTVQHKTRIATGKGIIRVPDSALLEFETSNGILAV